MTILDIHIVKSVYGSVRGNILGRSHFIGDLLIQVLQVKHRRLLSATRITVRILFLYHMGMQLK